jgi:hypothetical protein
LIGLTYQLLELTIDYTEYETVMDLRAEPFEDDYMAVTVCVKSKHRWEKNHLFGKRLSCFVMRHNQNSKSCHKFCPTYVSSTPFSDRCFTFLNCKYDKMDKWGIRIENKDNYSTIFNIHQNKIHPHLSTS